MRFRAPFRCGGRLPGHNHKWSLCPNNPRSKFYNGTHYKTIREQHSKQNAENSKGEMKAIQSSAESTPVVEEFCDYDSEDELSLAWSPKK